MDEKEGAEYQEETETLTYGWIAFFLWIKINFVRMTYFPFENGALLKKLEKLLIHNKTIIIKMRSH